MSEPEFETVATTGSGHITSKMLQEAMEKAYLVVKNNLVDQMHYIQPKKGKAVPRRKPQVKSVEHRIGITCAGFNYVLGVPHPLEECCKQCVNPKGSSHRLQWRNIPQPVLPDGTIRSETWARVCCNHYEALLEMMRHGGWEQYRRHRLQIIQVQTEGLPFSEHCDLLPVYYTVGGALLTSKDPGWAEMHSKAEMAKMTDAQTQQFKKHLEKAQAKVTKAKQVLAALQTLPAAQEPWTVEADYIYSINLFLEKAENAIGYMLGGQQSKPWLTSSWGNVNAQTSQVEKQAEVAMSFKGMQEAMEQLA